MTNDPDAPGAWFDRQVAAIRAPTMDYESALFDILEALKPHFPDIAGGFARGTGGVDLPYILEVIRA